MVGRGSYILSFHNIYVAIHTDHEKDSRDGNTYPSVFLSEDLNGVVLLYEALRGKDKCICRAWESAATPVISIPFQNSGYLGQLRLLDTRYSKQIIHIEEICAVGQFLLQ